MCAEPVSSSRRQRGVSIIELMVGIVVALLVGLAASGSAMMFTASQRQGVSGGSAAVSSATVLATLKNDAVSAGLGFFGDDVFLCNRMNLSNGTGVVLDNAPFSPVRITETATGDEIDLVYATRIEGGANVLLAEASAGAAAKVLSYLPVNANDAVLLAPPAPPPPPALPPAAGPCVVRTVTADTPSTEFEPQELTFANATTAKYNQAAFSTAPSFAQHGRVAVLGDLNWHRYSRNSTNQLTFTDRLTGASAVIADNVMALRAQYGIATTAASKTLAEWRDANNSIEAGFLALDDTQLPRVRALRIGMVTRAMQREKPPGGDLTTCESTPSKPQLFGTDITLSDTDWRCYRYRVSVVVVPLRNLVYGIK